MSWATVKTSWERASSFIASLASRGITDNRVSPEIRSLRILSCHGAPGDKPCPHRAFDRTLKWHFCNQCGCGSRELARISASGSEEFSPVLDSGEYLKLDFPYLQCPAGKPGFSNFQPQTQPEISTMIVPEKETPILDGPEQYGYTVQMSYTIRPRPRKPDEPQTEEITLDGSVRLQRMRAMKDGSYPQFTTGAPIQCVLKDAADSPEAEFVKGLEELIGKLAKAKGA